MHKRIAVILMLLMFSVLLAACGKAGDSSRTSASKEQEETTQSKDTTEAESKKILVAWFSATGNTKPIAEYAAKILDADLYEIMPEDPYTEEDLNYSDPTTRATAEQNDDSARPAISGKVENMDQYETVIIAHPIWWGEEPKIIDTFVESYDFTGKTMTTLCTSGGSGIETSAEKLKNAVSGVTWLDSRRFEAGADEGDVEEWLEEIGLK